MQLTGPSHGIAGETSHLVDALMVSTTQPQSRFMLPIILVQHLLSLPHPNSKPAALYIT
jgi:hypothetical protein